MANAESRIRNRPVAEKIFNICKNKVFIYCVLGDNSSATAWAQKGLSVAHLTGDQKLLGGSYQLLSFVHSYTGEYEKIEYYAKKALEVFVMLNDLIQQAEAISSIGYVLETRGHHQQAMDCYRRALAMEKQCGDVAAQAVSLRCIGSLHNAMGNVQEAIRCVRQSLIMTNDLNEDRRELGIAYNNMGLYYSRLSDTKQALVCYEKGWGIFNDIGYPHGIAILGSNIAQEYFYLGREKEASEFFANSLHIAQRIGEKEVEAGVLISLLTTTVDQESVNEETLEIIRRAEILALGLGYQELLRKYYIVAGHANCLMGRTDLGQELCRKASQIAESMESVKGRADADLLKARCLAADDKHKAARQCYLHAIEEYEKIDNTFETGRALYYLARSEIVLRDRQRAAAHCRAALACLEKLGYLWRVNELKVLLAAAQATS